MRLAILILLATISAKAGSVGQLRIAWPGPFTFSYFIVGDSKSTSPNIEQYISADFSANHGSNTWISAPTKVAVAGRSVLTTKLAIDDALALRTTNTPVFVLMNLGANDVNGDAPNDYRYYGTNAWVTNIVYIADACKAKWPNIHFYCMRVWKANLTNYYSAGTTNYYTDDLNIINDVLIPQAVSQRSWMHLGPDERVFLKGDDNGATMMTQPEGIHPNDAGLSATASNWTTVVNPP